MHKNSSGSYPNCSKFILTNYITQNIYCVFVLLYTIITFTIFIVKKKIIILFKKITSQKGLLEKNSNN